MICEYCSEECPEEFLSHTFADGYYYLVDPECALQIRKEIHHIKDNFFRGKMAQQQLEDYRAWKGSPKK